MKKSLKKSRNYTRTKIKNDTKNLNYTDFLPFTKQILNILPQIEYYQPIKPLEIKFDKNELKPWNKKKGLLKSMILLSKLIPYVSKNGELIFSF